MTKEQLIKWFILYKQIINGYHLSKNDKQELIRLNQLVMEASHKIHNDHMLGNIIN